MIVYRCDECCDVLDSIDNGVVYECDSKVESKLGFEHLCEDCLENSEELYLHTNGISKIVKLIEDK